MKARQMALCGLLTALAVVLMVLSGAIGIGTYCGPVLAMVALLPVLEEIGPKAAATVYVAAALLGVLLVPEIELAMVYAAFGWYPILRPHLARVPSRALQIVLKIALSTAVILLLYGVALRFLGMTADLLDTTTALNILLVVMGNVVFLLTDVVLGRMTFLWHNKLRKKILPR